MRILAYAEMKTDRAKMHLDALNAELRPLFEEPHTIVTREDIKKSSYIRRTYCKKIPDNAAMLLGEFLYCLRSGLDQLAWQLALHVARRDSPKSVYFPIFGRVINSDERRNLWKARQLFPSDVFDEIDALQPYKRPGPAEDHALWQLHILCNLDKHCIVPFGSAHIRVHIPRRGVATYLQAEDAIEVSVPLEDKLELDSKPNATFNIELGEWNADMMIPFSRLADIYSFVTDTIIPRFIKFDAEIPETPPYRTDGPITEYL